MKVKTVKKQATTKAVVKKPQGRNKIATTNVWQIHEIVDLATAKGWTTVGIYQDSSVVCFCKHNHRISYYYNTGTVACCLYHPNSGKSQFFLTNPSDKDLEHSFHNTFAFVERNSDKMFHRCISDSFGQPEPHLARRRWFASTSIGNELQETQMDADQAAVVALGKTWFVSYSPGKYNFGDKYKVHKALFNKLHGRPYDLPNVNLLVFGADIDTFFVQFTDGNKFSLGLPVELRTAIEDKYFEADVETLALGAKKSFFCLWSDGTAKWNNLPVDMEKAIRRGDKVIEEVTMGPTGQWFVRFDDGEWDIGGISYWVDAAIQKLVEQQHKRIVHVAFGHDDLFMITYE